MNGLKLIHFDRFLAKIKAQNQNKIFEELANDASTFVGSEKDDLLAVFQQRLSERTFGMGDGVAVFDVKSKHIKRPLLVIGSFEQEIDFDSLDGRPVDLMAAVLSPYDDTAMHLQRLAGVSRLLRCQDLCAALRDAKNADEMRVLFMPSQDWMVAA